MLRERDLELQGVQRHTAAKPGPELLTFLHNLQRDRDELVDMIVAATGYSVAQVARILDTFLAETASGPVPAAPEQVWSRVLVVLAGNTFVLPLQVLCRCADLPGNLALTLKPASDQATLVAAYAARFPRPVQLVADVPDYNTYDRVVVYGSDATIRALSARVEPARFVPRGHRFAIGVVDVSDGRSRLLQEETLIAAIADDVTLFRQSGCLSLNSLFIGSTKPGGSNEGKEHKPSASSISAAPAPKRSEGWAEQFCARLSEAIAARAEALPFEDQVFACQRRQTALADEQTQVFEHVILTEEPRYLLSRGNLLTVYPFADPERILATLGPLAERVQGIALAPWPETVPAWIARTSASYVCPFGRLQFPPLSWAEDNEPWSAVIGKHVVFSHQGPTPHIATRGA
jgi:hypothetical protein